MASRFEHNKPDPAIKKNVLQTRSRHQGGKYARAMVAGASVAATIMGWALFSTQDANTLAQTQAAQSTQSMTTSATQAQDTTGALALTTTTSDTSATTAATATATPVTSAQVVGSTVSAITSTRSSR